MIAGEFRGRRLASPPTDANVRPTSDRAREALFSILGDVGGLEVLDLFCGTAALGIEALSRGARHATLVDTDTRTALQNVEGLGLSARVKLVRSDAIRFLERSTKQYELIICDPPWEEAEALGPALVEVLPARLARGGRLVVESAGRAPIALDLIGCHLERERRYGESLLRIWRNQ
ncbi:MAG: RsmD family RNA methyltransferase [Actinomycetota bacterium]|nr:RsmD family RNA methyltransferase [Actinomycetota bacterium]